MAKKSYCCSFCGRKESDPQKLYFRTKTPANQTCICSDCISLCKEIIEDAEKANRQKQKHPEQIFADPSTMYPSKIKEYLDQHVIGQDYAKRVISVAIYNHYKRLAFIKPEAFGRPKNNTQQDNSVTMTKGNVLLAGPSGCGKTMIIQTVAKLLGVPFTIADATCLTEAGYVGEDVENIIRNLWLASGKNVEKTQMGIVCIDEIDKIAKSSDSKGRDVGGEGVQQALLKMLESNLVSINPDTNRMQPQTDFVQIDTSNILFILMGTFSYLPSLIENRIGSSAIGFHEHTRLEPLTPSQLRQKATTQDYIKYGLIPEFIGRIPNIVPLTDLDEDNLVEILWKPKNSLLNQYKYLLSMEEVELEFTPEAMRAVAKAALKRQAGARGLRAIVENTMLDVMYEVPSMPNADRVIIDEDTVLGKKPATIICKKNKKHRTLTPEEEEELRDSWVEGPLLPELDPKAPRRKRKINCDTNEEVFD